MAAASIKEEVRHGSPGSSSMPGSSSNDGLLKPGGEHSFPALHGLIMAEDRRTKEKEMNNFQNVSYTVDRDCYKQ
jgi:hypothetical protein